MGGGGGGGGGSYSGKPANARTIAQQIRDVEKAAAGEQFNAALAELFGSLLKNINERNTAEVNKRLTDLLKPLAKDLDAEIDPLFGGSVAKHTYVDGISDIDSLVVLNDTALAAKAPQDALDHMHDLVVKAAQGKATVEKGRMALTVKYPDVMEIQLLPAVRTDAGIKVPAWKGNKWSEIEPKAFSNALTRHNQRLNGRLVPTIKLAKLINATLPEDQQLSGYHIESLAIQAFRGYQGQHTTTAMLPHFFSRAKEMVKSPIRDNTGQSLHVDDYLGAEGSADRENASHLLGRIERRIQNASTVDAKAGSLANWKRLFGE